MKLLLSIALQCLFIASIAQSNIAVYNREIVSGTNYRDGSEITSTEFVFPEKISRSYIDTVTNSLTIELRGTSKNGKWLNNNGRFIIYDLSTRRQKWLKDIYYSNGNIEQINNNIFYTTVNKSYKLNPENGQEEWSIRNNLCLVDAENDVIIGYKIPGLYNTLEAYRLTSGERIWRREIKQNFGWNGFSYLNDSSVIVAAAGLHRINLKSGSGWDFSSVTGKNDYTGMVLTNVAGLALGILTGTYFYTTEHDVVNGIVSDIVIENNEIYFATAEHLVSYDCNGNLNWVVFLPKDMTSASSVWTDDSTIFIVNRGYAFFNSIQVDYGTPFLACYDKKTGKQIFITVIHTKKDPVMDFEIRGNDVLLVFRNRLSKYSLTNGSLIKEKYFYTDSTSYLISLAGPQVHYKAGSVYKRLIDLDNSAYFIVTQNNDILKINKDLEPEIFEGEFLVEYAGDGEFVFLSQSDNTVIIDSSGKEAGVLKASSQSVLIGKKLYDIRDKSYIETDLTEVLKPM